MPLFSHKWGKSNKEKASTKSNVAQNKQNGGLSVESQFFEEDSRLHTVLPNSVSLQDLEKEASAAVATDHTTDTVVRTHSRLTKTLREILHDKDALPYFIQYMDSCQAGQLIRFWLDAQSFQVSALTRVRSRSFNQESRSSSQAGVSGHSQPSADTLNLNNSASVDSSRCLSNHPSADCESGSLPTAHSGPSSVIREPSRNTNSPNAKPSVCDIPQCKDNTTRFPSNSVHSDSNKHQSSLPSHNDDTVERLRAGPNISNASLMSHSVSDIGAEKVSSDQIQSGSSRSASHNSSASITSSISGNSNSAHGGSVSQGTLESSVPISSSCDAGNANSVTLAKKETSSGCVRDNSSLTDSSSDSRNGHNSVKMQSDPHHIRLDNNNSQQHSKQGAHENYQAGCKDGSVVTTETNTNCDATKRVQTDGNSAECHKDRTLEQTVAGDKTGHNKPSIQDKLLQSIAQDAVRMFSKYIALEATHPIGVTEELRAETIRKICSEDGQVDPRSFVQCQDFVITRMETQYHSDFLLSCYHCKHQFDILSGSDVYLADFLYNETAFSYLTEYMEQEGVMSLLQCWLDLDSFQQLLVSRHGHYDGLEAQNDAMVIYEKYFSLQATQPLGFSDHLRLEVEGNICREEGPLPDCFCQAKTLVLRALEKCYFPGFVRSEVYFKYMTDLMNTVQAADIPTASRKRKESDAISRTSEHSTHSVPGESTTQNTLLAAGKSHGIRKALHKMEDNMQIDGNLFNPDALWKRPQSGKMSLGKVDELGRFVSELEIEPDNSDKPKLGFLKKRREKEQTEEEMAARIAMKIVAGITANTATEPTTGLSSNLPL